MRIKEDHAAQDQTVSVTNSEAMPTVQQLTQTVSELEQLLRGHHKIIAPTEAIHSMGEVLAIADDDAAYSVDIDGYTYRCERAASCLLLPAKGDRVLVSGPNREQLYIIAIIEQQQPQEAELHVSGHLSIKADRLSLEANKETTMQSDALQIQANSAQCVVDSADYVGKELRVTVSISRFVGKVYEVIVDRLSQMTRNASRITEQVDQTRAGTIDYQADDSARLHSKYTMVTAKELVKVDSDQIHMG